MDTLNKLSCAGTDTHTHIESDKFEPGEYLSIWHELIYLKVCLTVRCSLVEIVFCFNYSLKNI